MRYYVIGDEDTVLGLGMVGVQGQIVRNSDEAKEAFQMAMADREIGIVIITERAAKLIRQIVDKFIFTRDLPLIVEIPDRGGTVPERPGIREMVNASIGIKI